MKLKEKVALITGGSRGIGKSIALEIAKEGAVVIINYSKNKEKADETLRELKLINENCEALKADISKRDEVKEMFLKIYEKYEKIDILVNNAGILQQKPFETITDDDWDMIFDVNMKGSFICSQEAIKEMKNRNYGKIINISSIGGQWGGNLAVHYSATKAGIISLTKSLAKIYAVNGINVNCISPGLVMTEMIEEELKTEAGKIKLKNIPMGRAAEALEIAKVAVFLASDDSSYINGQTINVNGGMYFG